MTHFAFNKLITVLFLLGGILGLLEGRETVSQQGQTDTPLANHIKPINDLGGALNNVVVQDNVAFVAQGLRLITFDVQDPANPIQLGQSKPTASTIIDIAIQDQFAYLATGLGGLRIFDISDLTEPVEVGIFTSEAFVDTVSLDTNYAYVGQIPIWNGTASIPGGLQIIDIANPANPKSLGQFAIGHEDALSTNDSIVRVKVVVDDTYVYMGVGRQHENGAGLFILDVSNPTNPTQASFLDFSNKDGVEDIVIREHVVYFTTRHRLFTYDISNPDAPLFLDAYGLPSLSPKIAFVDEHIYLADAAHHHLHVVNTVDPADLRQTAVFPPISQQAITAVGNHLYTIRDTELSIFQVTQPDERPEIIGTYTATNLGDADLVAQNNTSLYLSQDFAPTHIVDITKPSSPTVHSQQDEPFFLDFVQNGTYGYWLSQFEIKIVDLTQPSRPREVNAIPYDAIDNVPHPVPFESIAVGDNILAATAGSYLYLFDVTEPAHPIQQSAYSATNAWGFTRLLIHANHVYLYGQSAIEIFDISTPAVPQLSNTILMPSSVTIPARMTIVDQHLYANGKGDNQDQHIIYTIDISNPTAATIIDEYQLAGPVGDLMAYRGHLFVSSLQIDHYQGPLMPAGLTILRIGDEPTSFTEVASYYQISTLRDLIVAGNYIYAAAEKNGLLSFWVAPPETATIAIANTELISQLDQTRYFFSADTFAESVTLTHTAQLPDDMPEAESLSHIHHFFEITAVSQNGTPITNVANTTYEIEIEYTDLEKGTVMENTLALYYWDGTQWQKEPSSSVDPMTNSIQATPNRFGLWGVFGETVQTYLPIIR